MRAVAWRSDLSAYLVAKSFDFLRDWEPRKRCENFTITTLVLVNRIGLAWCRSNFVLDGGQLAARPATLEGSDWRDVDGHRATEFLLIS